MPGQEPTTVAAPLEAELAQEAVSVGNDFDSLPTWAQDQIKSLRKESADRRTRLSSYEKAEEDRKAATLSDIEKANETATKASERAAALEAKLLIREATAALERANVIDAELALLAIRDKIVVADGEATNLEDLVAELVKNKPHLVKTTAPEKPLVPDTRPTAPPAQATPPSRTRVWGKI